MRKFTKPMKGYSKTPEWEYIPMPCYASNKLDGVRAVNVDGVMMSNSMKPLPNLFMQDRFGDEYAGLDGELILGDPTDKDCFRKTMSAVMTQSGDPDLKFHVFDNIHNLDQLFRSRKAATSAQAQDLRHCVVLYQKPIYTVEELKRFEDDALVLGYEGVIVRHPNGLYKCGRSTLNQGWMIKLKRFIDGEARVLNYIELFHNTNEAKLNELGYSTRSHHAAGKVGGDTLGALQVVDIKTGVEFEIGTGFDAAERKRIWDNRETSHEYLVKYKYFPIGMKDKPRHPVYLGMRHIIDMSLLNKEGGL